MVDVVDIVFRKRGDREVADAFRRIGSSAERTTTTVNFLRRALLTLGGALSAREVIRLADSFTLTQARIRLVTSSTEELSRAQRDLFGVAQETRSSFDATAELYSRVARNSTRLGLSQSQLINITRTVSQAITVSGVSAQAANAAIVQLGQALGSDELRGDELRSVLEQTPRLAQALADGLGVTIGQLRELGRAGAISTERVIRALQSQAPLLASEFSQIPLTFGGALTQLRNSLQLFVGRANESTNAINFLAEGISNIADFISSDTTFEAFSDTLEVLEENLLSIALVLTGRLAGSLAASARQIISNTSASIAQARANADVARSNVQKANSELFSLRAQQASLTAQLALTRGEQERARLSSAIVQNSRAIATASAAQTAATNALSQAQSRASISSRVLSRALTGVRAGLAFLGGPVGVVFTAIAAFTAFSNNSETTEERVRRLSAEISELTSNIENLTEAQRGQRIFEIEDDIRDLERLREAAVEAVRVQRQAVFFPGTRAEIPEDVRQRQITEAQAELDTINQQIDAANEAIGRLRDANQDLDDAGVEQQEPAVDSLDLTGELDGETPEERRNRRRIESLEETLATERELELQRFEDSIALIEMATDEELSLVGGKDQALIRLSTQTSRRLNQIDAAEQKERIARETQAARIISNVRQSLTQSLIGLLNTLGQESRGAAIAAIVLNKGLAIAQTIQNTAAASVRALAELGPIAGPPAAASISAYGAAQVGIIGATGLLQISNLSSSGPPTLGSTPSDPAFTESAGSPANQFLGDASDDGILQTTTDVGPRTVANVTVEAGIRDQNSIVELFEELNEVVGDNLRFDVSVT